MAKVSILITVYNEADYLRECLDSLKNQTFADFEAICVNDASTDNSLEILNEYARRDERFIVKSNPKNMGLTKSRSIAIKFARGEYISILDADDFFSVNAISEAIGAIEKTGADMALWNLQMYYANDNVQPYTNEKFSDVIEGGQAFRLCIEGRLHSVCMARRCMYEAFPFDDSCRLYSDDNTARMHLLLSRKICFCEGIYYYRRHNESETHKIGFHRFDYLIANQRLACELKKRNVGIENLRIFEIHRWKNIVSHYYLFINNRMLFGKTETKKILSVLKNCMKSMDFSLLPMGMKFRMPYWPTHNLNVFKAYQSIYCFLRSLKKTIWQAAKVE